MSSKKTWNFQLCPNTPGIIAKNGYRMDNIGFKIENEVNDALPSYLKFHKINKIVIMLGKGSDEKRDYFEVGRVGIKQAGSFNYDKYLSLTAHERYLFLKDIIIETFRWIISNFVDHKSFIKAIKKLDWTI